MPDPKSREEKETLKERVTSPSVCVCPCFFVLKFKVFARARAHTHTHTHTKGGEKESAIMGVFSRIRGSKKKSDDNKKQTGPTSSRMEERLRTARILAEDDDEDEPNKRRTQAQIERDLSDPRVHKRIVENLYGAYKIRVRLYISFLSLSFVLCCFLFKDQLREESDVENRFRSVLLSLSLCSLLSLFRCRESVRVDARCVWTTGRTSRRMGLKQETVFLFDDDDERERERNGEGNRFPRAKGVELVEFARKLGRVFFFFFK